MRGVQYTVKHTHSYWSICRLPLGRAHCKENPVYVFLFWELRGLSPNFHIHVSVSNLYSIFPGSVQIFPCSRIGRPILEIYKSLMSVETGRQNIIILFWKWQFNFWEYINWNQTFVLDSHRPFLCSADI
jgi:hypothetical protein